MKYCRIMIFLIMVGLSNNSLWGLEVLKDKLAELRDSGLQPLKKKLRHLTIRLQELSSKITGKPIMIEWAPGLFTSLLNGKIKLQKSDESSLQICDGYQSDQFIRNLVETGYKIKVLVLNFTTGRKGSVIPKEIVELDCLEELGLRHCDIRELPAQIGNLKKLKKLDLGYNLKLGKLPKEIGNLDLLEELNLDSVNNGLITGKSWKKINELKSLKKLSLKRVDPRGAIVFDSFDNLEDLNLTAAYESSSFNPLFREDSAIFKRQKLKRLVLANNEFAEGQEDISQKIVELNNLEELNLSKCNIKKLPHEFGNLKNLKILDLSRNFDLASLPDSFGDLANLEILNLASCYKLEKLPDSMKKLTELKEIQLPDGAWNNSSQEVKDALVGVRVVNSD